MTQTGNSWYELPSGATTTVTNRLNGLSYDSAGNQTQFADAPGRTMFYDAENLTTVAGVGTQASYLYDGEGRRVKKSVGGAVTAYTYNADNEGHFRATPQVTIQSDNISNRETIAHEGSHVADYQDFVKSIDFSGNMDQSLNITHMATEVRAYELSVRYALSSNSSLNFGPCGGVGQECKFSPGMMPAIRDQRIIDLLTDPRNHYTGLNTVLYPELLKPQQK